MSDLKDILEVAWNNLPIADRQRAVTILQKLVPAEDFDACRESYAKHGDDWVSYEPFSVKIKYPDADEFFHIPWHHSGGMAVRNALRGEGFKDEELPPFDEYYGEGTNVRNWDDYYVACFEAAAGIRDVN